MKKVVLLLVSVLAITACSQSKNIYFNGAEGSHSGIRYSTTDKSFSLNPYKKPRNLNDLRGFLFSYMPLV